MGRFEFWEPPLLVDGQPCEYGWVVKGINNFRLERETDIGFGTYIQAQEGVFLGRGVQIGGNCCIYSVDSISGKHGPVDIKAGACVGAGSVVLPNVTIGEDAIVGAGTVVLGDIPAGYTVWEDKKWQCRYKVRDNILNIRPWFWRE